MDRGCNNITTFFHFFTPSLILMAEMWMNTVVSFIDCIEIFRTFIYYWVMILDDIRCININFTIVTWWLLWFMSENSNWEVVPYYYGTTKYQSVPFHMKSSDNYWAAPSKTMNTYLGSTSSKSYLYDWIEHLNLEFELNDNCVHSNCWWNVSFSKYILIDRAGYRTEWRECSDESSSTAPDPAVLVALLADLL